MSGFQLSFRLPFLIDIFPFLLVSVAVAVKPFFFVGSHEESIWAGGKKLAVDVAQGVVWTAARWWGGGLDRIKCVYTLSGSSSE